MKDVVIKDIDRKTNFNRNVLREAAILAYSLLAKEGKAEDNASPKGVNSQKKTKA